MKDRQDIRDALSEIGFGERPDVGLAETAIWVGALDRPGLRIDRYQRHLDELTKKVAAYARIDAGPVPVAEMVEALFQVLSKHHGYGGTETGVYEEDCFELTRVIDQRSGGSEALAILYADVARQLDWMCEVLRVPGRMLLRFDSLGERCIVDPMGDAQPLSPADVRAIAKAFGGNEVEIVPGSLMPMDNMSILLRLLTARKAALLRARKLEDAADLIEVALILAPNDPGLWRESGLLYARLDRVQAAIDALEAYLRLGDENTGRYHTTILLQELRGRLT